MTGFKMARALDERISDIIREGDTKTVFAFAVVPTTIAVVGAIAWKLIPKRVKYISERHNSERRY